MAIHSRICIDKNKIKLLGLVLFIGFSLFASSYLFSQKNLSNKTQAKGKTVNIKNQVQKEEVSPITPQYLLIVKGKGGTLEDTLANHAYRVVNLVLSKTGYTQTYQDYPMQIIDYPQNSSLIAGTYPAKTTVVASNAKQEVVTGIQQAIINADNELSIILEGHGLPANFGSAGPDWNFLLNGEADGSDSISSKEIAKVIQEALVQRGGEKNKLFIRIIIESCYSGTAAMKQETDSQVNTSSAFKGSNMIDQLASYLEDDAVKNIVGEFEISIFGERMYVNSIDEGSLLPVLVNNVTDRYTTNTWSVEEALSMYQRPFNSTYIHAKHAIWDKSHKTLLTYQPYTSDPSFVSGKFKSVTKSRLFNGPTNFRFSILPQGYVGSTGSFKQSYKIVNNSKSSQTVYLNNVSKVFPALTSTEIEMDYPIDEQQPDKVYAVVIQEGTALRKINQYIIQPQKQNCTITSYPLSEETYQSSDGSLQPIVLTCERINGSIEQLYIDGNSYYGYSTGLTDKTLLISNNNKNKNNGLYLYDTDGKVIFQDYIYDHNNSVEEGPSLSLGDQRGYVRNTDIDYYKIPSFSHPLQITIKNLSPKNEDSSFPTNIIQYDIYQQNTNKLIRSGVLNEKEMIDVQLSENTSYYVSLKNKSVYDTLTPYDINLIKSYALQLPIVNK